MMLIPPTMETIVSARPTKGASASENRVSATRPAGRLDIRAAVWAAEALLGLAPRSVSPG